MITRSRRRAQDNANDPVDPNDPNDPSSGSICEWYQTFQAEYTLQSSRKPPTTFSKFRVILCNLMQLYSDRPFVYDTRMYYNLKLKCIGQIGTFICTHCVAPSTTTNTNNNKITMSAAVARLIIVLLSAAHRITCDIIKSPHCSRLYSAGGCGGGLTRGATYAIDVFVNGIHLFVERILCNTAQTASKPNKNQN